MFLESIKIVNVDLCVQQPDKYIAQTVAPVDLSVVMPYLNAIISRADYNPNSDTIRFYHNKIEFTLIKCSVNVSKFANRTELLELLDWFQELVNDVYESMAEITPLHTTRKRLPALTIYSMLPKTNCRECGEQSCMAFAARLYKMELDLADCPPLSEQRYKQSLQKLESALS